MTGKKKYPRIVKFFLADVIHADTSNSKPTLMGFFPSDAIGLTKRNRISGPSDSDPIVLQSLSILTALIDCNGLFEVKVSLFRPDGKPMFENRKIETGVNADSSNAGIVDVNVIVQFQPFNVPQYGEYKFLVQLDKKKYEYVFSIRPGVTEVTGQQSTSLV